MQWSLTEGDRRLAAKSIDRFIRRTASNTEHAELKQRKSETVDRALRSDTSFVVFLALLLLTESAQADERYSY
ncbi:MAG: hypothetical protein ACK5PZ_04705, partial [Pirellula sp.]